MKRISEQLIVVLFVGLFSANTVFAAYGLTDVKDVRVAPMLSSQWSVGEFGGEPAFNLYTPKNYSCGCGIVAYAQVMRYWCAPSGSIAPKTYRCWLDGNSGEYSTKGGSYAWDAMPLTSDECVNANQREALGHLAYDLGVASHVSWANPKYSYSYGVLSVAALRDYFGYASARTFMSSITRTSI